jgi:hypothetical protein
MAVLGLVVETAVQSRADLYTVQLSEEIWKAKRLGQA